MSKRAKTGVQYFKLTPLGIMTTVVYACFAIFIVHALVWLRHTVDTVHVKYLIIKWLYRSWNIYCFLCICYLNEHLELDFF